MANQYKVEAEFENKGKPFRLSLNLYLFKEGPNWILFCPSLDISGYGNTIKSAKESLQITLDEFVLYCTEHGTLLKELRRLHSPLCRSL